MKGPIPLHHEFAERIKHAWITRDPGVLEAMLADDIVTTLSPANRRLTTKKETVHWLGNLWVVQRDSWTDWKVLSDTENTCRIVGRAGYTNAAYMKRVTFAGTVSVEFRDGLAVRVDVDIEAALDRTAEASESAPAV